MSRSIRLLNLLQQLREARYPITAQVLAESLNISVRSVYRDIDSFDPSQNNGQYFPLKIT